MNTYTIKNKEILLNDDFEVIVVGGGPAGCAAALSAAREGAKTLLIEGTSALGGMSTTGLVTSWCPFSDKEKIIYRGLAEKIFILAKKGIQHINQNALDWVEIDPEYLKGVYDDLMIEAGVTVLFNTFLSAVETENGNVTAIIVSNKAGLTAYKANVYVDCTGDADLVAFAGGEFMKGDEKTGEMQSGTHCFILSNVDDYGFNHGPWLNKSNKSSPAYKIQASDNYPLVEDAHICAKLLGPSTVGFNAGHIVGVDNTNPISNSKAYMRGRKIAAQIRDGLKEFHPKAFGNSFLVSTATLLGIRETRRIVGDYILTVEDYTERKTFDDEIGRNSYFLDIHHPKDETDEEKQKRVERMRKIKPYGKGESHGIPYRCLTPKSLNNVLVAGRSISVERMVQGSVRVMPVCLMMGEAAGMAAKHSINHQNNVHKIDITHLRKRLLEENVYLL